MSQAIFDYVPSSSKYMETIRTDLKQEADALMESTIKSIEDSLASCKTVRKKAASIRASGRKQGK